MQIEASIRDSRSLKFYLPVTWMAQIPSEGLLQILAERTGSIPSHTSSLYHSSGTVCRQQHHWGWEGDQSPLKQPHLWSKHQADSSSHPSCVCAALWDKLSVSEHSISPKQSSRVNICCHGKVVIHCKWKDDASPVLKVHFRTWGRREN